MKKKLGRKNTVSETTCNTKIADVLNTMRNAWTVESENLKKFTENSKRPDILIQETGVMNVIIENEIEPNIPDEDAINKFGHKFSGSNQKSECIIALQTPKRFRVLKQVNIEREVKNTTDFKYSVYQRKYDHMDGSTNYDRFPTTGYLSGSIRDIANAAQIISISKKDVDAAVIKMEESIDIVAEYIKNSNEDARTEIAKILYQGENYETWKMAGLILSNAFIFHSNIAGGSKIKQLIELSTVGTYDPNLIYSEWNKILKINYYAIFDVAKQILQKFEPSATSEIIQTLVESTISITSSGLTKSTDMYGTLIQHMLTKRKQLASFYTLPESAALLSGIVLPSIENPIWQNQNKIRKIRFADFACGTGTLLTTVYKQMAIRYELNTGIVGRNFRNQHDFFMKNNIIGFDVLPSAVHLTVSSLASIYPKTLFEGTRIVTKILGKQKDQPVQLGSLDLMDDKSSSLSGVGQALTGTGSEIKYNDEIPNASVDYIIMNPPFTSNTREGGKEGLALFSSFDIDDKTKKQMKDRERALFRHSCADGNAGYATNFIAIADKKLQPGGTLGFVLPATIHNGDSWKKTRNLLLEKYQEITVVSIASSDNSDASFSFDTSLNEVLIIAKKLTQEQLKPIIQLYDERMKKEIELENKKLLIKKLKSNGETKIRREKKIPITTRQLQYQILEIKNKLRSIEKNLEKRRKSKRGKFCVLDERPKTVLEAVEISKIIHSIKTIPKLEKTGTMNLQLGNRIVGTMMDCPIFDNNWFVCVQDPDLFRIGYKLTKSTLFGHTKNFKIPMKKLGKCVGPTSRDIGQEKTAKILKHKKSLDLRSPFWIVPLREKVAPTIPVLWGNDNKHQKTLQVEPNKMAEMKISKDEGENAILNNKAERNKQQMSKIHVNILARLTSQALLVHYTKKPTLGSVSLPTVLIEPKYYKAFSVWSNSTLGILCFWYNSGKQRLGRGIQSRTLLEDLHIPDFEKIGLKKVKKLNKVFDSFKSKKLDRLKNLNRDQVRKDLDEKILNVLGIDYPLEDLRDRLANEPLLTGGCTITAMPQDECEESDDFLENDLEEIDATDDN